MELGGLCQAIAELESCEPRDVCGDDMRGLRSAIDRLERVFSKTARSFARDGGFAAENAATAVGWISHNCHMSATSAADRLCVGRELESLPLVAQALAAGEIGYQSASLLCHLREQLGEKRDALDEKQMVGYAKQFSVAQMRVLCKHARHAADPEGFERDAEEDFERRWLHINPMLDGMHSVDGVLDAAGAAAVRTALDALSKPKGAEDRRSHGQRQADALVELAHHTLDSGRLPRRRGVRPHVSVTTTLETLKGEVGSRPPTSSSRYLSAGERWSGWPATAPSRGCCSRTRW